MADVIHLFEWFHQIALKCMLVVHVLSRDVIIIVKQVSYFHPSQFCFCIFVFRSICDT